MSEPRKPLFGFLWPKPDPNAPVDAAYRQVRLVRVTPRGPVRVVVLVLLSALTAICAGAVVMASLLSALTPLTILGAAVAGTLVVLMLRGWVVGTYVNDDLVRVETTWRRFEAAWADVASITEAEQDSPLLGTPLRVPARRVSVTTRQGVVLPTHVYTSSPDLWLRPEAYDMALLRLERWQPRG